MDVLDAEARGVLLSLFALGAGQAALDRLDEQRRSVCAEAWRELRDASESERGRVLAEWRAEAATAPPRGIERLHPSWIVAALAGEPAHLLRFLLLDLPEPLQKSVVDALGAGTPGSVTSVAIRAPLAAVTREVERVAFARLASLCESDCGPVAERLCALALDELQTEVTRKGGGIVGRSLSGAAPALRARAMAAAGEPWARVIGEASAESVSDSDRREAVFRANAQIPDFARSLAERLLFIGLAALKSELDAEHPGSICRVAGRLPESVGRCLLGW